MIFSTPPEPLTPRQRTIALVVALVCAATRFLAMARSLWDWDEALLCLGMRAYDVTQHHPHPPGFPAYIALGKLVRLIVPSDFRALQSINLLSAALLFPALFLLARELRLRFPTAVIAAVLFVFFPNVWFYGGTAFSDIPSIVLVTFAATLLLRGVRDRNAYWLGTLLLAIAIGIRPQNLLIGLVPGIVATWKRRPFEIIIALLIGVAVTGAAFGGAIYATGTWDGYLTAVRHHSDYIARIDSFRAATRPPLWRLADRFFVKQYQSPLLSVITSLFVIASIAGSIRDRSRSMLMNALTFAPFALFAWLMLDRFSVSRFSIGYQPMFALFAADGIARVARNVRGQVVVSGVLVAAFIAYTLPALTPVRNEISPTVSAIETTVRNVDPQRGQLFVAYSMVPFLQYFAPEVPFVRVMDDGALPLTPSSDAWLLAEITEAEPAGFFFHRERGHLWNIARRHYFEVFLQRLDQHAQFGPGWYGPERAGMDEWRWMGPRSTTVLPAAHGPTQLRLLLNVPAESLPYHPRVTIRLNGTVLETVDAVQTEIQRDYRVTPAPATNTLEIAIDDTLPRPPAPPSTDTRDLRMSLRFLSWGKA
ncbi:MAG: hypothetical protein QOH21_1655 [Acidobacteriota bacterium]|nr:hypothetical protein [Acidobacteriota bacterium]